MLPAEHRLRDSDSFRRAVRSGRRSAGASLVVHLATVPAAIGAGAGAAAPSRFGLVVSRAVGDSVTRNRVKRRLRHLLRDRLDVVPAGSVVVVRALPSAARRSSPELRVELDRCLVRATRPTTRGSAS